MNSNHCEHTLQELEPGVYHCPKCGAIGHQRLTDAFIEWDREPGPARGPNDERPTPPTVVEVEEQIFGTRGQFTTLIPPERVAEWAIEIHGAELPKDREYCEEPPVGIFVQVFPHRLLIRYFAIGDQLEAEEYLLTNSFLKGDGTIDSYNRDEGPREPVLIEVDNQVDGSHGSFWETGPAATWARMAMTFHDMKSIEEDEECPVGLFIRIEQNRVLLRYHATGDLASARRWIASKVWIHPDGTLNGKEEWPE